MSIDIFTIPPAEAEYDLQDASIMIHDLNAPPTESTKMIQLPTLLSRTDIIDKILIETGYSKSGQDITYNSSWLWRIGGVEYTNPTSITTSIPLAASGMKRFDVFVLDQLNTFSIITGEEVIAESIIPFPRIPIGMLQAGVVLVGDNEISDPTPPVVGDIYVKKLESQDVIVNYGATTVIEQINLVDDRSSISLTGLVTDIKSIQQSGEFLRPGKPHFVKNRTAHDVTIWHLAGTGNVKYFFPNAANLVIKPDEVIQFNLNGHDSSAYRYEYVGVDSLTNVSFTTELEIGSTIFFTNPMGIIYNRDSPSSSNIILDLTGAKLGAVSCIFHNSATMPTITGATIIIISGNYVPSSVNCIWLEYLGSSKILVNIQSMQTLSAPTGLNFTKIDSTHIDVFWNSNGYNYTLQRATLSDFSDATTIYTGSTASYSDTVSTPNVYYYRVKSTSSGFIDSLYVIIQATSLYSGALTFVAGPNNLLTIPSTGVYSTSSSTSYAAYGNSDYKIPSGIMGYIDIKVPNSSKESSIICLATSNIAAGYTSSKFAFLLGQSTTTVSVFLNGTFVVDVLSGYSAGTNAKFRMMRLANGTCQLYKSSDSITFSLVYTFASTYTGDLWIVINPKNTTTEINNPTGYNLIAK